MIFTGSGYGLPIGWGEGGMIAQRWIALAGAVLALSGCGRGAQSPEQKWEEEIKAATGPHAMWYRFTFEAEYKGKPFKIDQMVTCQSQVISGGSLGQSPDTLINEGHPRTAAARMDDGSQVLVRIPNMCRRYRDYDLQPGHSGVNIKAGWRSRGPHSVTPLVIWSDSVTKPERIESYVARSYYDDPRARISKPNGSLEFWPVGTFPKNAEAVLKQKDALPFYPHPNVNPQLGENSRAGGRDGDYHGKGQKFEAAVIVPIDNPEDAWAKYDALLPVGVRSDVPRFGYRSVDDEDFLVYTGIGKGYEQDYFSAKCIKESLSKLMIGAPGMSSFVYDPGDHGSSWPMSVRTPGSKLHSPENLKRLDTLERQMRHCYEQLGKLRSFEFIDGRLDASRGIPGVIVYGKWGKLPEEQIALRSTPISQAARSPAVPNYNGSLFRINGADLVYNFTYSPAVLLDKKNQKWSYFSAFSIMFDGEGENIGFNY